MPSLMDITGGYYGASTGQCSGFDTSTENYFMWTTIVACVLIVVILAYHFWSQRKHEGMRGVYRRDPFMPTVTMSEQLNDNAMVGRQRQSEQMTGRGHTDKDLQRIMHNG